MFCQAFSASAKPLGFLLQLCYNSRGMEEKKYKCVLVTGPESSGSRLVARIVSRALGIQDFEQYNGIGTSYKGADLVEHFSLPSGAQAVYPDIKQRAANKKNFDLYFVLATRDINISKLSKMNQYGKNKKAMMRDRMLTKRQGRVVGPIRKSGKNWIYVYSGKRVAVTRRYRK